MEGSPDVKRIRRPPHPRVTRLERLGQTAVPDLRSSPRESRPEVGWGFIIYSQAESDGEKRLPLFILMRHSNQLSCKYVSTLINLRVNGDLYPPVLGLFYTGSEDLLALMGIQDGSDGKCCSFFFFFNHIKIIPLPPFLFHVTCVVNKRLSE